MSEPEMDEKERRIREQLDTLPVKTRNRLLFDLLTELGIEGLVMPGENGTIEGFVADRVIALKYFKNRVWSKEIVEFARAVLTRGRGGTYVDLGANIGLTTVPVAHLPGVNCIAVEAHPENFRLLNLNLVRNGVTRKVTAHLAAIYKEAGTVPLQLAPENLGDHRLHVGETGDGAYHEAGRRVVEVPAATLDELIGPDELVSPVVMKMDIQGSEPYAFHYGARVLAATDVLLMEYWPYGIERLGTRIGDLHDLIAAEFGFGALLRENMAPGEVRPLPFDELRPVLEDFAARETIEATDLVLARSPGVLRFD